MNKILTNRRDNEDEGFTLIELMVVVLIIAILLAIAIPTFLGAQDKAKDRGAQSAARNTLTTARTIYADSGSYTTVDATTLLAAEPGLTYSTTAASASDKNVSVNVPSGGASMTIAVLSKSGMCYLLQDTVTGTAGTLYAKYKPGATSEPATCIATGTPVATPYSATGWG